eukprot:GHVS01062269.1.p1 GENE.GHVS01062269.1~~GHVS01062269.1.p1  ORF type:complete len:343 (+),score=127.63 GHVS01062269.1:1030-2058(+)
MYEGKDIDLATQAACMWSQGRDLRDLLFRITQVRLCAKYQFPPTTLILPNIRKCSYAWIEEQGDPAGNVVGGGSGQIMEKTICLKSLKVEATRELYKQTEAKVLAAGHTPVFPVNSQLLPHFLYETFGGLEVLYTLGDYVPTQPKHVDPTKRKKKVKRTSISPPPPPPPPPTTPTAAAITSSFTTPPPSPQQALKSPSVAGSHRDEEEEEEERLSSRRAPRRRMKRGGALSPGEDRRFAEAPLLSSRGCAGLSFAAGDGSSSGGGMIGVMGGSRCAPLVDFDELTGCFLVRWLGGGCWHYSVFFEQQDASAFASSIGHIHRKCKLSGQFDPMRRRPPPPSCR